MSTPVPASTAKTTPLKPDSAISAAGIFTPTVELQRKPPCDPKFTKFAHKIYGLTLDNRPEDYFIFLPTYMTLLVKTLQDIDSRQGTVKAAITLIVRIGTGNVPQGLVEKIKSKLGYRINEISYDFTPDTPGLKIVQKDGMMTYTYRGDLLLPFQATIRKAPFDDLDVCLDFELTSGVWDRSKDKKTASLAAIPDDPEIHDHAIYTRKLVNYRFNLHKCDFKNQNLTFKAGYDKLPEYDIDLRKCGTALIAERKERGQVAKVKSEEEKEKERKKKEEEEDLDEDFADYEDDALMGKKENKKKKAAKEKKAKQEKIERKIEKAKPISFENLEYIYYPKLRYTIKLIHDPWSLLFSFIFPLFFLEILSLAVFAQDHDEFSNKLGNVCTIMLALLAYIPTIRKQFPPVPYLTFCDFCIYCSLIVNALALLEAVIIKFLNTPRVQFSVLALAVFTIIGNACLLIYLLFGFAKLKFEMRMVDFNRKEVKRDSSKIELSMWRNDDLEKYKVPEGMNCEYFSTGVKKKDKKDDKKDGAKEGGEKKDVEKKPEAEKKEDFTALL